ncbi:T3SS negative regulator,GrlR [Pseudomonas flavescens]|uniref:T3SS negative regulator,GrlR n=1 Tax=Phytopseudomonas flavescens TaxID=29435 RepID=A0A1G7XN49_9GAMM|nr:GrlR family regulatory protein [Pseudomonas flavescens]SDG85625.1 T3SS negative regulator,GrlR [Pseudomonas flavescens]
MVSGIYEVEFKSSMPDEGGGLIVIKDGSVNGGDEHFLYRGTIQGEGDSVTANIQVSQWKSGNTSIVGASSFTVELKGSLTSEHLHLSGSAAGFTINVRGRRITDTA